MSVAVISLEHQLGKGWQVTWY